jgi:hypothetical protein
MFQEKPFGDRAFHGDEYLLRLVDYLMPQCIYFVETGVHRGDTFAYVAHYYSYRFAVGCEPNEGYLREAEAKVEGLINVETFPMTSQEFLPYIHEDNPCDCKRLYWLDAHGHGFDWPLAFEVEFITSHYNKSFILIDDFQVPGKPQFSYDISTGNICSYKTIKPYIKNGYQVYYPAYTERTSKTMNLVGWGLLVKDWKIPEELKDILC